MKKSTIEKIEKEIDEKTKLPYEIKDKIKKDVFTNIVIASIIILYFIFIVLGSFGSVKNVRAIDLNIFSILFLGIAIFLFEIAYKKDDGKLAMYGIESLVVAVFTLFLPYIIFELDGTNKKYYLMASIYIAAYYILKSIYIYTKTKNKYMNNISDVKDLVKKEKTKRRIKEEIEETKVIKENKNKKNINEEKIEKQQTKVNAPKNIKENKEETKRKRRGRPKKSETTNNQEKLKEEAAPKKRGRPRKVVANND